jgi:hypothetical protein
MANATYGGLFSFVGKVTWAKFYARRHDVGNQLLFNSEKQDGSRKRKLPGGLNPTYAAR